MSIQEGVYTFLSGQPAVTALVGTRIYAVEAETNPGGDYLVYEASSDPVRQFNATASVAMAELTVTCVGGSSASSPDPAEDVAAVVKTALDGLNCGMGNVTVLSSQWLGEESANDPDRGLFAVIQHFEILYEL